MFVRRGVVRIRSLVPLALRSIGLVAGAQRVSGASVRLPFSLIFAPHGLARMFQSYEARPDQVEYFDGCPNRDRGTANPGTQ